MKNSKLHEWFKQEKWYEYEVMCPNELVWAITPQWPHLTLFIFSSLFLEEEKYEKITFTKYEKITLEDSYNMKERKIVYIM